jgi:hypothetical protein
MVDLVSVDNLQVVFLALPVRIIIHALVAMGLKLEIFEEANDVK